MLKSYIYTISLTFMIFSTELLADGFYQQVMENTSFPAEYVGHSKTEFSYSPLYLQVVGDRKRPIDMRDMITDEKTCFSYTPLYNKVRGYRS